MAWAFRLNIVLCVALLVSSCVMQGQSSMSIEEANEVIKNLAPAQYKRPERSISSLKDNIESIYRQKRQSSKYFNNEDCEYVQEIEAEKLNDAFSRSGSGRRAAAGLVVVASRQFFYGQYKNTESLLWSAQQALPEKGEKNRQGVFAAQRAMFLAASGDASGASSALADANYYFSTAGSAKSASMDIQRNLMIDVAEMLVALAEGELTEAEAYGRRAYENRHAVVGSSYWAIPQELIRVGYANALISRGKLAEAEFVLRNSSTISCSFCNSDDRGAVPYVLGALAALYLRQGRIEDAAYLNDAALRFHEVECTHPKAVTRAQALQMSATLMLLRRDFAKILDIFSKIEASLNEDPDTFNRIFKFHMARIAAVASQGQPDVADALLKDALANTKRPIESAFVAGLQGVLYARINRPDAARDSFSRATTAILSEGGDSAANVIDASVRNFILEEYLKFLDGRSNDQTLTDDELNHAFGVTSLLSRGKVQKVISQSAARIAIPDKKLSQMVRREQDALAQLTYKSDLLSALISAPPGQADHSVIAKLRKEIETLRQAHRAILKEIESDFPEYAELINPSAPSIADVRTSLRSGEVLISTYVGQDRTYVWAIPQSGEVAFNTIDIRREDLELEVDRVRASLDPGSISTLADIPRFKFDVAYGLFEKLLKPVAAGWKAAKHIVLVPNGPLGRLPFSVLPTEPFELTAKGKVWFANYRDAPWLANSHSITMLPSVGALKALRKTRSVTITQRQPFVGFGDPFFSKEQAAKAAETIQVAMASSTETRGVNITLRAAPATRSVNSATLALLPRLRDTRPELLSIANSLGAEPKLSVFLGADASEGRVKSMDLTGVAVLAFATHGLVPGDLDGLDQPALALSSPAVTGGKGDGLLTMGEILGLKLNADWVVLSACNTAAADGLGAEAVSGLGRAFFYAGARALLVSNWPVHSAATTELTTTLFKAQADNPDLNRAEALRRAWLHMINKGTFKDHNGKTVFSYAHPLFWAPFTIVGDGGSGRPAS